VLIIINIIIIIIIIYIINNTIINFTIIIIVINVIIIILTINFVLNFFFPIVFSGTLLAHSAVHSVLFSTYETTRMLGMYCVLPMVKAVEEEENLILNNSLKELQNNMKNESIMKKILSSNNNMSNLKSPKSSSKNLELNDPGPTPLAESSLSQASSEALNLAAETFVVVIAGKNDIR
jgi:predicted membrane protein